MPGEFTPLATALYHHHFTQLMKCCCGDPAEAWHFTRADDHQLGQAGPPLSPLGVAGAPLLLLPVMAGVAE